MGRPGLLEFAIYGLIMTGTASWVFGLPPFTHEPGSSRPAEVRPVAASISSDSAEQSEAETESRSEPRTVAREQAPAAEAEASQTATSEPDEQPRLDPQPDLLMVTATRLNMRSQPNARSQLVGSYPRGALVEEVTTQGNWVLVRTVEDESMGWMYAGYLDTAAGN